MRPPSSILIVDANICISALLGRSARVDIVHRIGRSRTLAATDRIAQEVYGRVTGLRGDTATIRHAVSTLLEEVVIYDSTQLADRLGKAATVLRGARQDGKGSDRDAHVLALAWTLEADVWTHDGDFAGTGWPSWSSRNLLEALV